MTKSISYLSTQIKSCRKILHVVLRQCRSSKYTYRNSLSTNSYRHKTCNLLKLKINSSKCISKYLEYIFVIKYFVKYFEEQLLNAVLLYTGNKKFFVIFCSNEKFNTIFLKKRPLSGKGRQRSSLSGQNSVVRTYF